jgi:glycosyltransferase involved in cell wall biosynthesis
MRVLHVLGKLDRGGVETWLVQVLRHIDRQEYQMDFLVHTTEPGAYDQEVRSLGARIIPCLSPSQPGRYAMNFWRILQTHGPYDVVHSHVHHFSGYVLMLAAMAGVPVRIAHSHTSAPEHHPSLKRKAYLGLMRYLIRVHASLGIAISGLAGNALMPNWSSDSRWHLRPYGVETSPFAAKVDCRAVRETLGISAVAPVVCHVGRFVEVKNHRFMIAVAKELTRLAPDVVFLLVGDGPLRAEIESSIKHEAMADRFILTGIREDIPQILQCADAFLFPSLYEGLGIALMEAQFAGLPCLVSDVIPSEATMVSGSVRRLPLSAPTSQWARELHAILVSQTRCLVPAQILQQHSVEGSISELAALYRKAPIPTRTRLEQRPA